MDELNANLATRIFREGMGMIGIQAVVKPYLEWDYRDLGEFLNEAARTLQGSMDSDARQIAEDIRILMPHLRQIMRRAVKIDDNIVPLREPADSISKSIKALEQAAENVGDLESDVSRAKADLEKLIEKLKRK